MKMKFYEAVLKMQTGDKFVADNPPHHYYKIFRMVEDEDGKYFCSDGCTRVTLRPCFLKLEGEIIPAEPKVLTAEDMFDHLYSGHKDMDKVCFAPFNMIAFGMKMHQNGRLERDLELRPLLKKLSQLIEIFHGPTLQNVSDLMKEISSLYFKIPHLNNHDNKTK